mmetsp:Transcript_136762/g.237507  ORF Transcript_136762/g.237507 Transcript_136762/m.237507 type:complete len:652 (-) Transcript_136762:967-2922(-)
MAERRENNEELAPGIAQHILDSGYMCFAPCTTQASLHQPSASTRERREDMEAEPRPATVQAEPTEIPMKQHSEVQSERRELNDEQPSLHIWIAQHILTSGYMCLSTTCTTSAPLASSSPPAPERREETERETKQPKHPASTSIHIAQHIQDCGYMGLLKGSNSQLERREDIHEESAVPPNSLVQEHQDVNVPQPSNDADAVRAWHTLATEHEDAKSSVPPTTQAERREDEDMEAQEAEDAGKGEGDESVEPPAATPSEHEAESPKEVAPSNDRSPMVKRTRNDFETDLLALNLEEDDGPTPLREPKPAMLQSARLGSTSRELHITIVEGKGLVGWGSTPRNPVVCLMTGEDTLWSSCKNDEVDPTWNEEVKLAVDDDEQAVEVVVKDVNEDGPTLGIYCVKAGRLAKPGTNDLWVPLLLYNSLNDAMEAPDADSKLHLRIVAKGFGGLPLEDTLDEGTKQQIQTEMADLERSKNQPQKSTTPAPADQIGTLAALEYPEGHAADLIERFKRSRPARFNPEVEEVIRNQQMGTCTTAVQLAERQRREEAKERERQRRQALEEAKLNASNNPKQDEFKSEWQLRLEKNRKELAMLDKQWAAYRAEMPAAPKDESKKGAVTARTSGSAPMASPRTLATLSQPITPGQSQAFQNWR